MRETIRYYAPGSGLRRPYRPLNQAERASLHGLQQGRCYLCGEPFAGRLDPRLRATEDHVLPQSRGGGDWHNRMLAHFACNNVKADRMPHPCELIAAEAIWLRLDRKRK